MALMLEPGTDWQATDLFIRRPQYYSYPLYLYPTIIPSTAMTLSLIVEDLRRRPPLRYILTLSRIIMLVTSYDDYDTTRRFQDNSLVVCI